MSTVTAEAVAEAINAANTVRRDNGQPIIEGLPQDAVRENEGQCVLARAFNFECQVNGYLGGARGEALLVPDYLQNRWFAEFAWEHADQAQQLADALGTGIVLEEDLPAVCKYGLPVRVPLPEAVAAIAVAFDEGELDPKDYAPTHAADGTRL